MTSPFIPCPFQYTDIPGPGAQQAIMVIGRSAPPISQNQQAVGTLWLNPEPTGTGSLYYLAGFVAGVPQWEQISSGSGSIVSVSGTGNQITASTVANAVTLSIPAVFIAPGSITSTTIITSGADIFALTGDITVANGDFEASAVGTGIVLNSPNATGAAASPVVLNARSGRVTFTSVSIAAAADLTLTITNSEVTASTTQVIVSMSGATTGSALSIKSKTSSAGSLAIVVTNGTGATTTTADIQIDFLVLNA